MDIRIRISAPRKPLLKVKSRRILALEFALVIRFVSLFQYFIGANNRSAELVCFSINDDRNTSFSMIDTSRALSFRFISLHVSFVYSSRTRIPFISLFTHFLILLFSLLFEAVKRDLYGITHSNMSRRQSDAVDATDSSAFEI